MNNIPTSRLILGGIVLVGLVVVVYMQFFRESEFDRQYRENMEKGAQGLPTPTAPAPGAPANAGAPAPAGAPSPVAAQSQFAKAQVDIDSLLAEIKEVDFDYDTSRTPSNPMTPLVGPMAPARVQTDGAMANVGRFDEQAFLHNLRVTGILFDKFDPMAVMQFPVKGELMSEVVTRGFAFPGFEITVNDIETDRVILNVNNVLVPIELEEQ